MSAELLREAAALMRERAEAASVHTPSPWRQYGMAGVTSQTGIEPVGEYPVECDGCNERVGLTGCLDMRTAEHIASWHPAVALAVADWLERCADKYANSTALTDERFDALAVARAYLGGAS